jgi:hypothetical protein
MRILRQAQLIFWDIKEVLLHPSRFFKNLRKEKGIKNTVIYLVVLSFIGTVLLWTIDYFFPVFNFLMQIFLGVELPRRSPGVVIFYAAFMYVSGIVFSFVTAGILYLWLLVFGGKLSYNNAYSLLVYSRTPLFLFSWIPFLGWFSSVYDIILLIMGAQRVAKISRLKAILIFLIPAAVFVLFFVIMLILVMLLLGFLISSNPDILSSM